MKRLAMAALLPLLLATPVLAQHSDHSQHTVKPAAPSQPKAKVTSKAKPKASTKPAAKAPAAPSTQSGHKDHHTPSPPAATSPGTGAHSGHDMSAGTAAQPVQDTQANSNAGYGMSDGNTLAPDAHAGHDLSGEVTAAGTQIDPNAGHDMSSMDHGSSAGADEDIPHTPPPPAAMDHLADLYFDPARMAEARHMLHMEHGGMPFWSVMFDRIELTPGDKGGRGYAWDAEFSYGGDIHRFVVRTEGEGAEEGAEDAELQLLYSRAVSPYFNLQAGIRQDFEPKSRTYLTVGTEGLFPYWFEVEGGVFLSNEGELLGRVEGTYDLRLTQRWILQPSVEVLVSSQNIPDLEIGSGLASVELGLRLRYEIRREFAPYIGMVYERKFGETADIARAAGHDPESTRLMVGIRTWF